MVGPTKRGREDSDFSDEDTSLTKPTKASIPKIQKGSKTQKGVGETERKVDSLSKQREREEGTVVIKKKMHVIGKSTPTAINISEVAAEKIGLNEIAVETKAKNIVPHLDMESLFAFGATDEQHARIVVDEIRKRHPSLLPNLADAMPDWVRLILQAVTPIKLVLDAKNYYQEEKKAGEYALLNALKNSNQAFESCETLNDAMSKKELILKVKKLRLDGDSDWESPMFLPRQIGQFTALELLEVTSYGLTTLPSEIGQCVALRKLNVYDNQLVTLPSEIGQCVALKELCASNNKLMNLPSELWWCIALEELHVDNNQLDKLSPQIGHCVALKVLEVSHNQLVELPSEIGHCLALKELDVSHNQLVKLPREIGQCVALWELEVSHNQLVELPSEIGQCCALEYLIASNNQLVKLPPEICQCVALKTLNVSNNQLMNLPSEIWQCVALEQLDVTENNQLMTLPPGSDQYRNFKKLIHGYKFEYKANEK